MGYGTPRNSPPPGARAGHAVLRRHKRRPSPPVPATHDAPAPDTAHGDMQRRDRERDTHDAPLPVDSDRTRDAPHARKAR